MQINMNLEHIHHDQKQEYNSLKKDLFEILSEYCKLKQNIPLRKVVQAQKEIDEYLCSLIQADSMSITKDSPNPLMLLSSKKRHQVRLISCVYWIFENTQNKAIGKIERDLKEQNENILDLILDNGQEGCPIMKMKPENLDIQFEEDKSEVESLKTKFLRSNSTIEGELLTNLKLEDMRDLIVKQ
ncbi:unnamed protein product [Moneuplotes crassus]|uniref:Uncharacterized protein n=1 Tax=Euplotes crassus TaxID=5936 RepID=A0AAD1X4B7_EUPCR|nr:unnamed protein product [Moneuplotes crassus]